MGWKSTLSFFALWIFSVGALQAQTNCGDTFYDSGGANGQYQNSEFNSWTFCPDNPGDLVTLNFTSVQLELCCDDLMVFNGSDTSNPLNTDLEAPESFTSTAADGCLTVTWSSDFSVTGNGWECEVTCAPPPPCPNPTLLTATNVTASGATIGWAQVGSVMMWDLEIVPAGTAATGVPTVTGTTTVPFTWADGTSGTEYDVYVRGYCENAGEFTNWVGPVSFTTNPACGDIFYDSGGANGQYQNNELATWTFCPDNPGDLVTLNFTLVDLENCCDNLQIFNGTGTSSPLELDLQAPASFTSSASDGCLTVTWDSDGSVVRNGWEALISCAPAPPCPNPTMLTVTDATSSGATIGWAQVGNVMMWDLEIVPAGTAATGVPTVTGTTSNPFSWADGDSGVEYDVYVRGYCENAGEFTNWVGPVSFTTNPACGDIFYDSGGANGQYQNSEVATWTFCPDEAGEVVTLLFTLVDVETCCDVIRIFNGTGTAGTMLEGDLEAPEAFTSTAADGCLTVTWSSDGSVVRNGWAAAIICAPPPACPNPSGLAVANVTNTGADLSWTENGTATAWDLEIVPLGTDPTGVPTVVGTTNNPYTWTGGESGTTYVFYVRAQCGFDNETSNWIGPFSFTTSPGCGDMFFDSGGPDGNYSTNEGLLGLSAQMKQGGHFVVYSSGCRNLLRCDTNIQWHRHCGDC
ncbi:MAG: hypothetical protein R2795_25420 [Saprospiraceae bacterium]